VRTNYYYYDMKYLLLFLAFTCPLAGFSRTAPIVEEAYQIWFSIGQVQHHALLLRVGNSWEMRVRYYDNACKCQQIVQEKFEVEQRSGGIKLRGHSVQGIGSQSGAGRYAADNLYLYFRSNGAVYASNIDEAGEMAALNIQTVKHTEKTKVLQDFQWESK
jgi:hypothetical protein